MSHARFYEKATRPEREPIMIQSKFLTRLNRADRFSVVEREIIVLSRLLARELDVKMAYVLIAARNSFISWQFSASVLVGNFRAWCSVQLYVHLMSIYTIYYTFMLRVLFIASHAKRYLLEHLIAPLIKSAFTEQLSSEKPWIHCSQRLNYVKFQNKLKFTIAETFLASVNSLAWREKRFPLEFYVKCASCPVYITAAKSIIGRRFIEIRVIKVERKFRRNYF